ncbi:prolyl hydroxylase family protein [Olleya sp. Bg11-27]|uniref:prolyl hydroxylase family protein n=1 Tax=Olleya sp. Bg11-27 TaxID=2058135 RepID=UPI000C2FF6A4|nr:2OG-Fe(II) oxygenase [Olleya sp. Bg11-27]AUC75172.1 oxidoreductase, 2OG-Fe(II) oxygenase [Olleya sp. Bg11-27]
MKRIDLHRDIFIIEDFLTSDECELYINYSSTEGFEEAKIGVQGNQVMNKNVRNNDRLLFFDLDLAKQLWGRVCSYVPKEMGLYKALDLNEMFRVYRYSKGQRFKMHRDGSYERNEKECSFFSFIIYLNDDFEGGETEFRKLFTVSPKKGSALLFYHPHRHEGKEIVSGVKYVLRTDVMYKLES